MAIKILQHKPPTTTHAYCIPDNFYLKTITLMAVKQVFIFFFSTHKHADIQIYRNFAQWIEACEGHSPVVKAAKML